MDFISDAVGGVTGAVSGALKLVTSQVDEVVNQLTQSQNLFEELVQTPIQGMIKSVSDGTWTGDGANAFLEELNQAFLPDIQSVSEGVGTFTSWITQAASAVQQADAEAAKLVEPLVEEFRNIYKG
jgi:uncharacterized protein YukE